jgi:MFS family permease
MRHASKVKSPHYAWIVLACVMVLFAISTGSRMSFGVYIDPLVEKYGWSRSSISFAYTLSFMISVPLYVVVGWLADRIGSRKIIMVGSIIFTLGMLLTATITQVWQFQVYFGLLIGGLGTGSYYTLLPVLVTKWFQRKLGLALGLMWASLSLGTMVFSPLLRWSIENAGWSQSIENAGWSQTFVVYGLVGGILILVVAFFLKDDPRDKNLTPYGAADHEKGGEISHITTTPTNLRTFLMASSFLALVTIHLMGCIGHSIPLVHMVSIATFAGIPGITAAGMLSITSLMSLISRFVMSLVADAKGARFTLTFALLLQSLPIMLLLREGELWWFYSFAFLFGLGYGGEMVGFPIFNRRYYGVGAPLNTIYAYQSAGASLGMAIGGWLGAILFDLTGAYAWAIAAAVIAGLIAVVLALTLPPHHKQRLSA